MRIVCGIGVLALGFGIACAGRTDTPNTSVANTAGAQAAARLTVQYNEARETNIGSMYPEMRENLSARKMAEAADQAQQLAIWFGDVERFWAQNNKPEAVKLAQRARTLATEVAGAATAGDAAKAAKTAASIMRVCNQCHGTYREANPAGGFRVKAQMVVPG